MRLWRCAAVCALVLLVCSNDGRAEPGGTRPQAALDVKPVDSPIVPLLRAELRELGVDLVDEGTGAGDAVTIHVALTSKSLDVQIVDRRTGQATVQETFPALNGTPMDPRTAVLHVVELLRWHLRFTPAADVSKAASTSPPEPKAAQPAPLQTLNTRIGLTPLAAYSPGGAGVGMGGQVDVFRRWGRFGARILGGTVLVPNRMSVAEGSLEMTANWAGLAGVLILGGDGATTVELGAGGSIFVSTLHGTANADNLGQDDRLVTFSPFGDLRLRRRITQGFGLSLNSSVLVPLQSSRLVVLGRGVGRYGEVMVALGIGAELAVF
jgi:hypothetical protein